ncbi:MULTISPECIES: XdhC family protein [unclassified Cytobacillus]|uniref:XdhC family protein n=1 Tax=unclassified Cytobacillus TaxID=2675268 RepID=UPI001358D9B7|nr:XdhC family protein [Cytobacillus sp. AMY 15.2]KAF0817435.1 Xanthine and CO dehydrogenases maturation factor, XdhC/CoxF family [Bacillus sp. ZZV12-4809]MCM3091696.1 XdhC family protein [Cytobacillus sp. AMY 15.2]
MSRNLFARLEESIKNRKDTFLLTITDYPEEKLIGTKALLWPEGEFCTESSLLPMDVKKLLTVQCNKLVTKKRSGTVRFMWNDSLIECFAEYFPSPLHLIVAGAGHVCEPVAEMGRMLGFFVTVIDDRKEFANRERFPKADEVVCQSYLDYFRHVEISEKTYILLLTRGHKYDVLSLNELLKRKCQAGYIGMIGSRRRISGVFEELHQDFPDESFENLYTPVGLDIGAETPAEIAVSIMAEILKVKNQKSGDSLSSQIKRFAKLGFREGAGKWTKCSL